MIYNYARLPTYNPVGENDYIIKENVVEFRQLIEAIDSVFWTIDTNSDQVAYISPAYEQVWGRSCQSLYNDPSSFFACIYQEDLSKVKKAFERLQVVGEAFDEEYRIILPDGSSRWIWARMFPIYDDQNSISKVVGIAEDISKRKKREYELIRLATIDYLTGVNNRYSFLEKAEGELIRCLRYKRPFTFLMIDIDNFKQVNDRFGHYIGDKALQIMAKKTIATLRKTDIFGRLGGEEFGVVLVETDVTQGLIIAERLRSNLAKIKIKADSETLGFTVSIGITTFVDGEKTIQQVMRRADKALYQAKNKGRNCIVQV